MHFSRTSLLFYCIRLLCVFSPGYIHPDEFFQSQEVIAHELFNTSANVPWEFSLEDGNLYRSMLPIYFSCGIPYILASFFMETSPYMLWLAPRIFLFVVSIGIDRLVWRNAQWMERTGGCAAESAFFVYQTSWVTLVFGCRPFSNTLEAMLVAASFYVALHWEHCFIALGWLYGCGVFTRITFPVFVVPLTVYTLGRYVKKLEEISRKRNDRSLHWAEMMGMLSVAVCRLAVGFGMASVVNILVDTRHVRKANGGSLYTISVPTIAPLNNLIYNVDTQNLARHGLHPRYLHALVNMQVLFGPLWVLGFRKLRLDNGLRLLCGATIITAVAVLSAIPHQEMRFLVPLVLPISLIYGRLFEHSYKMRLCWVIGNLLVTVFFGFVHQAGVVPLTLAHAVDPARTACVYAYETYMVPQFLFGLNEVPVKVHNLKEYAQEERISKLLSCEESVLFLPATALPDVDQLVNIGEFSRVRSWWPHFCGERLGSEFELRMYRFVPLERP